MRHLLLFILSLITLSMLAEPWPKIDLPIRIPLFLSGNFGELRSNHFHTGIDFKTETVVGKTIYAVDEGWVSRISISPSGYGKALYITHPSGLTSVYAHLLSLLPPLDTALSTQQYAQERFAVELTFAPGELPIKRGQPVALSGNTGSSGGPHLHFELRKTSTEEAIDPLPFYREAIADTRPPLASSLAVYHFEGNNMSTPPQKIVKVIRQSEGNYLLSTPLLLWGKVGFGIIGHDLMNGTSNTYGVTTVKLFCNNKEIYSLTKDKISFAQNRYLNSYIDYGHWVSKRRFIAQSFIQPNNQMAMICLRRGEIGNGVMEVNKQGETYAMRYELIDLYGNKSEVLFSVIGDSLQKKSPHRTYELASALPYYTANFYQQPGMSLNLPANTLYENLRIHYAVDSTSVHNSLLHKIDYETTPMHQYADLTIDLTRDDATLSDKYYLAFLSSRGEQAILGSYEQGKYKAKIRNFGNYAVRTDTVPPRITPLDAQQWSRTGVAKFRISDSQTGINSYRVEIDGSFALAEFDAKTRTAHCSLDPTRLSRKKTHTLRFIVSDGCNNYSYYTKTFYW